MECQFELRKNLSFVPMSLYAVGAGLCVLGALMFGLLLWGADYFVLPTLFLIGALVLGVFFTLKMMTYQDPKPKRSLVEPLVIKEAMPDLPGEDHTFPTSEQYLERY